MSFLAWAWRPEIDQPRGIRDRKRLEQDPVEHRENRGVGPDPQRQRGDRHRRDEGRFEQRAAGEFQVDHVPLNEGAPPGV